MKKRKTAEEDGETDDGWGEEDEGGNGKRKQEEGDIK